MKKLIMIFMLVIFAGVLTACGASGNEEGQASNEKETTSKEKKVLVMGTSADYPPFEFVQTSQGEDIIGFDIDLANAIAEKLDYEIEIKDIDFSGLIPALQSNKIDFVLSSMTPTEERKENVDFSQIYYEANHMIVSPTESNIGKIEELEGKTVGVQLASIQADKAEEIKENVDITIESRNRIPELVQEMKAGRFDAAIIEDTVAKGYLDKNEDLTGFVIENAEEAGTAAAFPKNSELVEEFDQAITELKESGELEEMIKKWFDSEESQ
ncbi:transporter substrate-binding domain-containing protein [Bacillus solimangrovi]|uniref:ABC transporter substrate-binding protein n=1 Tax=Bacillus solimangrovi TaxID=1305675 RepID=A0A1E5LKF4_9BACI|nr:transporter substrate-binding domain-containing protein [Bacillus solimangrovi]OEH94516.1 ABC transporter substrate-binding protein [Bacillus solimangrovi]